MDLMERLFLRGEQRAAMIENYLIPKLEEELGRRKKEAAELRETVDKARTGDENALIDLTRLAFPLKGKD